MRKRPPFVQSQLSMLVNTRGCDNFSDMRKAGRPRAGEAKGKAPIIHVALDDEAMEALRRLENAVGAGVTHGRRSIAVRRALLETAARLKP